MHHLLSINFQIQHHLTSKGWITHFPFYMVCCSKISAAVLDAEGAHSADSAQPGSSALNPGTRFLSEGEVKNVQKEMSATL